MDEENVSVENSESKISTATKERRFLKPSEIISYCLITLTKQNIDEFVNAYRQKFAIDNIGIGSTTYANIALGTTIYDALDDTISGLIIDRTRTRWGKIKPYLLLPIPLWFIGLYMLFNIPSLGSTGTTLYYIAATVIYGLGMSYFGTWSLIMYNNTPNVKERNTLITVSSFAQLFGVWAVSLLSLPLDFLPKLGIAQGTVFKVFVIFSAVLNTIACVYGFTHMRERIPLPSREDMNEVGIIESFKQLLKNPQMFIYIFASFCSSFKSVGAANEKFFWFHCTGKYSYATLVSLFTGMPNYFMTPLAGKLINKFGAKKTVIVACFFAAAAYTTMWAVGFHPFSDTFDEAIIPNLIWIGFALTICGLPNCILKVCFPSIMGDVFDYSEWKSGIRNEALVNTISGYFGKLGNSLNGWLSGMVLTWIGYVAQTDANGETIRNMDSHVHSGLWLIFALVPAIARLTNGICFLFFKVDGKFKEQMLADLKERRQAAIDELEKEEKEEGIESDADANA